jgi:hypothetical protein
MYSFDIPLPLTFKVFFLITSFSPREVLDPNSFYSFIFAGGAWILD